MKNNKAVLGLLVIAVLLIFGFVTKQVFTQLAISFPFGDQLAKVPTVEPVTGLGDSRNTTSPPRGGGVTDEAGWTVLVPSATSRITYLADNGNDSASCTYTLSQIQGDVFNPSNTITPCKTVNHGLSKLRNGQDDYLLFKRGNTWSNSNTYGIELQTNRIDNSANLNGVRGFSASRKMVIASWAPASAPSTVRPKFNISTNEPKGITLQGSYTNGNEPGVSYVALMDLHLYFNVCDTCANADSRGIEAPGGPRDLLIENMKIERFSLAVYAHGNEEPGVRRVENLTLRRNIFADSFCPQTRCGGLLLDGDHLTIEENFFDHNGFVGNLNNYQSDIFSHNAYVSFSTGDATDLKFRKNMIIRGSDGGKLGAINGGVIEDNFTSKQAMHVLECCEQGQILRNNVAIDGLDYNSVDRRAFGYDTGSGSGLTISGNIFAHQKSGTDNAEAIVGKPFRNTTITNNIVYNWCLPSTVGSIGSAIAFEQTSSNTTISNNQFQQDCPPSSTAARIYKEDGGTANGPTYSNNKYWTRDGMITANQGLVGAGGSNYQQWITRPGGERESSGTRFEKINYPDPNRDASTYMNLHFGGNFTFGSEAGLKALGLKMRAQSRWSWDPKVTADALTDYIRCGFAVAPLHGFSCTGGTPDTQPPVVSLTAPANGATVSATVPVSATATDNVAVAKVEFYRGTTLIGTDTSASSGNVYSVNWNTTQSPNGSHIITAKAYDTATPTPNTATSQPRTVTVNNSLSIECQRFDMDNSGSLGANDFSSFQSLYTAGNMRADIDQNTVLNANDFQRFLNGYVGCTN